MDKVLGVETLKTSKGTFFKLYVGFEAENVEGLKVRDYFLTVKPDVHVGDYIELIFGAGYDMKAYLKEIRKVDVE